LCAKETAKISIHYFGTIFGYEIIEEGGSGWGLNWGWGSDGDWIEGEVMGLAEREDKVIGVKLMEDIDGQLRGESMAIDGKLMGVYKVEMKWRHLEEAIQGWQRNVRIWGG
jgi:hypothetical protein